jgi:hypothetical protein
MTNKNQHWVPKFLIKQFADTDGRVFRFDIHTDEVTKPPPKYAAAEIGFYEFEIDGEVISFEDSLEKIETKAAPILKRFIETRSLAGITPAERECIADFMAAQSFRTEAFYKGLGHCPSRKEFGPIFAQLWESAFFIAHEIAKRHWALMAIESDEVFYLGDNPVVLQRTENPKDGGNLGFDVQGVEAYMPISPKCALYVPCRSISNEILSGYKNAHWMHGVVRSAALQGIPGGSAQLNLAQRVIRQAGPLFRALTMGAPLPAVPENIENLNYLQCSWAYAAIYSNRRSFEFAQQVFHENPQYRTSPNTKLVQLGTRNEKTGAPSG